MYYSTIYTTKVHDEALFIPSRLSSLYSFDFDAYTDDV